jgi:hypothetical protein
MADSVDRIIAERLEVLSRTVFPINYVFSKTYEYAVKHPACAMTIVTKTGNQVNFTKPVLVHPKVLQKEGPWRHQNRIYYVREIKIIDSHLVLTPDQLRLPSAEDPERNLAVFAKAVQPYLAAVEDILRRRFATIVIPLSKREKPLVLQRQTVKGPQILTANELFKEMQLPKEIAQVLLKVLFRSKPAPKTEQKRARKGEGKPAPISAAFLTLEDGRVVLPTPGVIQAQEYVQLGMVPYHFATVQGPVPETQIVTSFLQLENRTVAQLLEAYGELAYLPFFLDIYRQQGGPPIRHVALFDGRLIIGRTPNSTPTEGHFEVFLARARLTDQIAST